MRIKRNQRKINENQRKSKEINASGKGDPSQMVEILPKSFKHATLQNNTISKTTQNLSKNGPKTVPSPRDAASQNAFIGVGGRRHAAFPRPSRDPARGGGAAGSRLSSVINRAPILALLCAKNERVFAKTAPCSRHPCALVGDWAAINVSLRPRVCRSFQRVFGRFASQLFLVPLENPRFSHI